MKLLKPILLVNLLFLVAAASVSAQSYDLPPLPSPEQYGNILINRLSEKNKMKPVTFSHWIHRTKYTCRVCHLELEFTFKLNSSEITEKANQEGRFCGACHNGKTAFGHTKDNCAKCHSGDISFSKDKFKSLSAFPKATFGNKVNWVAALNKGLIRPKDSLQGNYKQMPFDKKLDLITSQNGMPPVLFSHKSHAQWLDCSNCHPDMFNVKKHTTKHFSMARMIKGEFCGACHLKTAFPLNDCAACHPNMH